MRQYPGKLPVVFDDRVRVPYSDLCSRRKLFTLSSAIRAVTVRKRSESSRAQSDRSLLPSAFLNVCPSCVDSMHLFAQVFVVYITFQHQSRSIS